MSCEINRNSFFVFLTVFKKLQSQGFPRSNAVHVFIIAHPNVHRRGIMHHSFVSVHLQPTVSLHVIVYFYVGGIPYVLFVPRGGGKFLDQLPVVATVELIAVTPNVKQPIVGQPTWCFFHKFAGQFRESFVFMMTSGVPRKPFFGETESPRRYASRG